MTFELNDVTGSRGEKILELHLTDFESFRGPLFRPSFLGEKWPAIDYYIELVSVRGKQPYFFAQVKTSREGLSSRSSGLLISTKKRDIERLLQIPGPTYVFGVHEPTRRVFVRSVHTGIPMKAITQIPGSHEVTGEALQILYNEVRDYWATNHHKPHSSHFA